MKFILSALLVIHSLSNWAHAEDQEWNFRVLLDGAEIGKHNFLYDRSTGTLTSEAKFRVKFLFYTAYSYEHSAREIWNNNCLNKIAAKTEENGKVTEMQGEIVEGAFEVRSPKGTIRLPECPMTFAYWNPQMLEQSELLNPQTGEWHKVKIRRWGLDLTQLGPTKVPAERFELTGPELNINLWYKNEGGRLKWVALSAITHGKRLLRYELI